MSFMSILLIVSCKSTTSTLNDTKNIEGSSSAFIEGQYYKFLTSGNFLPNNCGQNDNSTNVFLQYISNRSNPRDPHLFKCVSGCSTSCITPLDPSLANLLVRIEFNDCKKLYSQPEPSVLSGDVLSLAGPDGVSVQIPVGYLSSFGPDGRLVAVPPGTLTMFGKVGRLIVLNSPSDTVMEGQDGRLVVIPKGKAPWQDECGRIQLKDL